MKLKTLSLIVTIFLSGCCGIPQKAEIKLPDKVACPEFTNMELASVPRETYAKVVELHIICSEDIQTYRDIIKAF